MTKMHWCPNVWSDARCGKTVFYNYNRCMKKKSYTCQSCGNNFCLEDLGTSNSIRGQLSARRRRKDFFDKYYCDSSCSVKKSFANEMSSKD